MPKRMIGLVSASLVFLAACSGGTPTAEVLPTLAQLPTVTPSPTALPPTPTLEPSPLPEITSSPQSTDAPAEDDLAPAEPTATLLPIMETSQPDAFPTLVSGEEITLQGLMTLLDDSRAVLTDSEGHTVTVLIDPFAAQLGANQQVRIRGMVELEGDQAVLRMVEITQLTEATPEPESTETAAP